MNMNCISMTVTMTGNVNMFINLRSPMITIDRIPIAIAIPIALVALMYITSDRNGRHHCISALNLIHIPFVPAVRHQGASPSDLHSRISIRTRIRIIIQNKNQSLHMRHSENVLSNPRRMNITVSSLPPINHSFFRRGVPPLRSNPALLEVELCGLGNRLLILWEVHPPRPA